jgi:alpha-tubulin suppressor-like RCC1 family protein
MSINTNRSSLTQVAGYTTQYSLSPIQIGTSWKQLSVGGSHALAIKSNNLLYAWGLNSSGQLGDGTYLTRSSPVQIGLGYSWNNINAGASHSLALRSDNLMYVWGSNTSNQLGLGGIFNYAGWKSIATGWTHTLLLRQDNTLWAVGENTTGQLGKGDVSNSISPVQIGNSSWSFIAAGPSTSFAIDINGRLFSWGYNAQGQLGDNTTVSKSSPVQVGSSSWTLVRANPGNTSLGQGTTAAIDVNSNLFMWGSNSAGQIGDNTLIARSSPVQVSVSVKFNDVALGLEFTLAIRNDRTLWSHGYNLNGELGHGNIISRSTPVQLGFLSNWSGVGAGLNNSYALNTNRTLYGWGTNIIGTVGDGTVISRSDPVQIANGVSSVAVKSTQSHHSAIDSSGKVIGWGLNSTFGQLGDGTTINKSNPTQVLGTSNWLQLVNTQRGMMALDTSYNLWAWGGDSGQGDNYIISGLVTAGSTRSSPVQVGGTLLFNSPTQLGTSSWTAISAGTNHTLAIRSDKTLWAWGNNNQGQLFLNTVTSTNSPLQVGTSSWNVVSAGNNFSLGIDINGLLFSSGNNQFGQLARNNITDIASWSVISAGESHLMAIKTNGTLWGWGRNFEGQLGDGTTITRSSPIQIGTNNNWSFVRNSQNFTVALDSAGRLYAWGYNFYGSVGDNSIANRSSPVQIASSRTFSKVDTGSLHVIALEANTGFLFAWGWNGGGNLGDGSTINRSSPVQISNDSWIQIGCGPANIYAIRYDGILFSAGPNTYGQLGLNDTVNRNTLTQVGNNSWKSVFGATGPNSIAGSVFAIRSDNKLFAWGSSAGYLGDGTFVSRSSPVQIGASNWQSIAIASNDSSTFGANFGIQTDGSLWIIAGFRTLATAESGINGTHSWIQLATGGGLTQYQIRLDGTLWGVGGDNWYGQLGDSTTIQRSSPVQIGTSYWTSVAAGENFALAIDPFGSLFAWGQNSSGQLGYGDGFPRSSPVQITQTVNQSWSAISAGMSFATAINSAGELYAWGANVKQATAQTVQTYSWTQVNVGNVNVFAIRSDNTLYGWGSNNNGELGLNDTISRSSPVQIGAQYTWSKVVPIGTVTIGLQTNGTVWSWGASGSSLNQLGDGTTISRSSPVQLTALSGSFIDVTGYAFSSPNWITLIKNDGTLFNWAWATTDYGQSGYPLIYRKNFTPVQVSNSSWTMISVHSNSGIGIRNNKLYTWGSNVGGQLGTYNPLSWIFSGGIGYSANNGQYAIDSDGTLWTWAQLLNQLRYGGNIYDPVIASVSSPTQVGLAINTDLKFSKVAASTRGTYAITNTGKLFAWGTSNTNNSSGENYYTIPEQTYSWTSVTVGYQSTYALRNDGVLFAWGNNSFGQMGIGTTATPQASPTVVTYDNTLSFRPTNSLFFTNWNSIATAMPGAFHMAAINSNGTLFVWGYNASGQIGDGTTVNKSWITRIGTSSWTQVTLGANTTLAIRKDGYLFSWGLNNNGQLGDGSTINRSSPVQLGAYKWSSVVLVATTDGNNNTTLAIRSDNTLWAWGMNSLGQLGDSTTITRSSPVQIAGSWLFIGGSGATQNVFAINTDYKLFTWGAGVSTSAATSAAPTIASGIAWNTIAFTLGNSAIAADRLGRLYSWGTNESGVLGDGLTVQRLSPIQIHTGASYTFIAAGGSAVAAIRSDTSLWGWGNNQYGQFGTNETISRSSPVNIGGGGNYRRAAIGNTEAAYINTAFNLFTSGRNNVGQLGFGDTVTRSQPVQIGIGNSWIDVHAGQSFFVALDSNSKLWAWGLNTSGQLGDGTTINRSSPVQITSSVSYVAIGTAWDSSVAIDNLGRLYTWGINNVGQLGFGDTLNRSSPSQVGTSSWSQVQTGQFLVSALRIDNTLWAWGWNIWGQVGDNTIISRSSPVQMSAIYPTSFTQLNAITLPHKYGVGQANAILWGDQYALELWGIGALLGSTTNTNRSGPTQVGIDASRSSPVQVGTSSWIQVTSAGSSYVALIRADNSLWMVGNNTWSQYGDGTTVSRGYPAQMRTNVQKVSLGGLSGTTMTLTDNKLYAAGYNATSELGLGNAATQSSWTQVGVNTAHEIQQIFAGSSFTQVATSQFRTMVIKDDATLWTWGYNNLGQLGLGDTISRSSPVQISGSWSQISLGLSHSVGLRTDGTVYTWGGNSAGQLGDGTIVNKSSPIQLAGSYTAIGSNEGYTTYLLKTDGTLWGTGYNNDGMIGDSTTVNKSSPIQIGTGNSFSQIGVYSQSILAVRSTDNTLWAWGLNTSGQLGDGTTTSRSSPVQITSMGSGGTFLLSNNYSNFLTQTTIMFIKDSLLYSMGLGTSGELGDNTAVSKSVPTLVASGPRKMIMSPTQLGNSNWSTVSAGNNNMFAIDSNSRLFTWGTASSGSLGLLQGADYQSIASKGGFDTNTFTKGFTQWIKGNLTLWAVGDNSSGELGDNTTVSKSSPIQIGSSLWTQVSIGVNHIHAIRVDGTLWGWGNATGGTLGDGTTISRSSPVQIGVKTNWTNTDGWYAGAHAINSLGQLWGWGVNTDGVIGDNTNVSKSSPVQIGSDTTWLALYTNPASNQVAAIKTDSTLWTWGVNTYGQLGDNSTISRSSPVQIAGSWTMVSMNGAGNTGNFNMYGIKTDGTMWGWGRNNQGATGGYIGDDTSTDASSPVQIGSSITTSWKAVYGWYYGAFALSQNNFLYYWGSMSGAANWTGVATTSNTITLLGGVRFRDYTTWTRYTFGCFWPSASGLAYVWGVNSTGLLGDTTTVNKSSPVVLAGTDATIAYSPTQLPTFDGSASSWISVKSANNYTYAIKNDYTLWAWGNNNSGQFGDGTTISRSSPVQVGGSSWAQVGGGTDWTLAIKMIVGSTTGTLWAWGRNNLGQLGLNDTIDRSSPVQVGTLNTWTKVVRTNGSTAFALTTSTNNLYIWGDNSSGAIGDNTTINKSNPVQITSPSVSWTQIGHGIAVTSTGTLYTWGNNSTGSLGLGDTANRSAPTQVGLLTTWSFLPNYTYSNNFKAAGTTGNVIWAMGANDSGQLGDNSTVSRSSPVQVAGGLALNQMSLGVNQMAAITTIGTLYAWGNNSVGSLGVNDTLNRSNPTQITGSWTSVWATTNMIGIRTNSSVWAWGRNNNYSFSDGTSVDRSSPVQVGSASLSSSLFPYNMPLLAIACNNEQATWIIDASGLLYAWGVNTYGQLGDNTTVSKSSPTQLRWASSYTQIGTFTFGSTFGLALKSNYMLDAFGINSNGQLGDGTTITRSSPVQIGTSSILYTAVPNKINNTTSFNQVIAGNYHAFALNTQGLLYGWGENTTSQLGNNTAPEIYVETGTNSADGVGYAITSSRRLFVWGLNTAGQLGFGDTINRSSPVQLAGSWTSVTIGHSNMLGIRTDGTLWGWGYNNVGGLGDNTVNSKSSPVQIGALANWFRVIAGATTYAINTSGQLYAWGYNANGQLGDNTTINRSSPVQILTGFSFTVLPTSIGTNTLITTGALHVGAIDTVGRLWTWGNNAVGQLGFGDTLNRSSPIQIGTSSWTQISVGGSHTMALRQDNTIWTWGINAVGQLGDNTTISRSSPVQVGTLIMLPSWKMISAGLSHNVAIRADNTLWAWGLNTSGQLGDSSLSNRSSPVQVSTIGGVAANNFYVGVGGNEWSYVSAGYLKSHAIAPDGQLFAWGNPPVGVIGITTNQSWPVAVDFDFTVIAATSNNLISSPTQIGTSSWSVISAGARNSFGIKPDGTLWGWGSNYFGSLGIVAGDTLRDYNSGGYILNSTKQLYVWGGNVYGQLGQNDTINRSNPVQVGGSWLQLASTNYTSTGHKLAIDTSYNLWSWGYNNQGQLGDGTTINRSQPVQILNPNIWKDISAGNALTMGLRYDGSIWAWGAGLQLGQNDIISRSSPVQVGTSSWLVISAAAGCAHAIRIDGTLWGWGSNSFGQVGDGTTVNRSSPVQIGALAIWSKLAVSGGNSLGGMAAINKLGQLFVWGLNNNGQLGDNTFVNKSSPIQIMTTSSFTFIAAGEGFRMIDILGKLYVCGENTQGELGTNTTIRRSSPVQVGTANSWIMATMGSQDGSGTGQYTLALATDGTVWTWGNNSYGQLGDNTTISRSSPVQMGSDTWSYAVAGTISTAIRNNLLYVWGRNLTGALGLNDTLNRSSPVQLSATTSYVLASSGTPTNDGGIAVFAITTKGFLISIGGRNSNVGQFGDGTTIARSSPVQIGTNGTSWTQIFSVGADSGAMQIAIMDDNTLWAWGQNLYGQLGQNDTISRSRPVQILGSWTTAAAQGGQGAGTQGVLAIKTDGTLWAWGDNTYGQLGDGTTVSRSSPVQIGSNNNWSSVAIAVYTKAAINTLGQLYNIGGWNNYGEFGDDSNHLLYRSSPVQIMSGYSFTQIVSIFSSAGSYIARTTTGTIWSWGLGNVGQLGDGTTITRSSPVQIGTSSWVSIGSGTGNNGVAIGLLNDGTTNRLFVWGNGLTGQLGDNTVVSKSSPVQLDSVYTANTFAFYSSPVQIGTSSWIAVSTGGGTTFAIKADFTLWAWGNNGPNGQLGNNTTIYRSSPVQIGTSSWIAVSVAKIANYNTYPIVGRTPTAYYDAIYVSAIRSDGLLFAWGNNPVGNIGNNTTGLIAGPVQINTVGQNPFIYPNKLRTTIGLSFITVGVGASYVTALKTDGLLYVWGTDGLGQLADNSTVTTTSTPITVGGLSQTYIAGINQIGNSSWSQVSAGYSHTLGITRDSRLFGWGSSAGVNPMPIGIGAGNNAGWQYSGGSGGGGYVRHAIRNDGTLWATGYNNYGVLGDNTTITRSSPVQVSGGGSWIIVDCASYATAGATYAIKTNYTLWAWGQNAAGQLVQGDRIARSSPVQIPGSWASVCAATYVQTFVFAIKPDNTLWAWGDNSAGQLGDATIISRSSPVQVFASKRWLQVAVSDSGFTVALDTDNIAWSWGRNIYGQLGDNTTIDRSSPYQIGTEKHIQVAASINNIYLLRATGQIFATGLGQNGGVGDNNTVRRSSPVQVASSSLFKQVVSKGTNVENAFAIDINNNLWAWGYNLQGELGDNTTIYRSSPVQITASGNVVSIAQSGNVGGYIDKFSQIWLWGFNTYGGMGDNTTVNKSSPVQVNTGLTGIINSSPVVVASGSWTQVRAGNEFSLITDTNNALYFWGRNDLHQSGTNSYAVYVSSPIQIGSSVVSSPSTVGSGGGGGGFIKNI